MNDPDNSDDGWNDLARELNQLGLDKLSPAPSQSQHTEEGTFVSGEDDAIPFAELADSESDDGDVGEDTDVEVGTESTPSGDDPAGPGRKRRRRRRRRKKSGAPGTEDAGAETNATEDRDEQPARPVATRQRRESRDTEVDRDDEADDYEQVTAPLAAEEDTGGEVLRDLIATWNVPSWDEIVGGLYRPER